jgi:hypothetical protein
VSGVLSGRHTVVGTCWVLTDPFPMQSEGPVCWSGLRCVEQAKIEGVPRRVAKNSAAWVSEEVSPQPSTRNAAMQIVAKVPSSAVDGTEESENGASWKTAGRWPWSDRGKAHPTKPLPSGAASLQRNLSTTSESAHTATDPSDMDVASIVTG